MRSKLKQGRAIAAIAAAAILTAVLVLTVAADNGLRPGNGEIPASVVVATVNGVEITQGDVAELRAALQEAYGRSISPEDALEELIRQEVVYQEAKSLGYLPEKEYAEERLADELWTMWGITMDEFRDLVKQAGLSYDEQLEAFGRDLATRQYLAEVELPEVTEEEARDFYDEWIEELPPGQQPPSYESLEEEIVTRLGQDKLVEALVEKAHIEYLSP